MARFTIAFLVCMAALATMAYALPAANESVDVRPAVPAEAAGSTARPVRNMKIAALQVALDRAGFSPGVIDGLDTPRFRLAQKSWSEANPLSAGETTPPVETPFVSYTLTAEDVAGPFTPDIPVLYVAQASLPVIGYRNAREAIAEKFHMDEDFLAQINPGADFAQAGQVIRVAATGRDLQKPVFRIEADKTKRQLRAYDEQGTLIAAYPASIGSKQTPSPSGTHTVRNKAQNPAYTYDPQGSAQPGQSNGLVLLPPGPNGPVGNAWIGLSKKTFGIHGTPDPSDIGITASVGCVRLTNWDALELARLVRRGVTVTFID